MVIDDKSTGENILKVDLPLSLSHVEKMFYHRNLVSVVGGDSPPETKPYATDRNETPNNPAQIGSTKHFVFVHGYNVNQQAARGWHSEFFKRLHRLGSKARFHAVSWHSYQSQIENPGFGGVTRLYQKNVINAFSTASALATYLDEIPGEVNIAAHSLGNMVVSSAIVDHGAEPKRFFLINAAVSRGAFRPSGKAPITDLITDPADTTYKMEHPAWREYHDTQKVGNSDGNTHARRLWASDWHRLWPESDGRSKLAWSSRFSLLGEASSPTQCYNLYSSTEDVLANPKSDPISDSSFRGLPLTTLNAWNLQERWKGHSYTNGMLLTSTYGGWFFTQTHTKTYESESGRFDVKKLIPPSEAFELSDAVLRDEPFFHGLPSSLKGAGGSDDAIANRATYLAEMIPAISFAAGRNEVDDWDNWPMNERAINWPKKVGETNTWVHSDVKEFSLTYTLETYEYIFDNAQLHHVD